MRCSTRASRCEGCKGLLTIVEGYEGWSNAVGGCSWFINTLWPFRPPCDKRWGLSALAVFCLGRCLIIRAVRCHHSPTTLINPQQPSTQQSSTTLNNVNTPQHPFTTLNSPQQPSAILDNRQQPSTAVNNRQQPLTVLKNRPQPATTLNSPQQQPKLNNRRQNTLTLSGRY